MQVGVWHQREINKTLTMALVEYYKSRTCAHNVNEIPMESGLFGLSNGTSFALWGHLVVAIQAS
jgi:hypothetical protein